MAKHLYGMHDYDSKWASLVKEAGVTAWCVQTLEIGDNPNDHTGWAFPDDPNVTFIGRLNYSHHGEGTIPKDASRWAGFAKRCANFVKASARCKIWIIGNEPNIHGEGAFFPISYVECYRLCYEEVKKVAPDHKVMIAPLAPWNIDTLPWMEYWKQMLNLLVTKGIKTDGVPIHTYSRGANAESITSNDKMDSPYQMWFNGFRTYQDWVNAIPVQLHGLPVYITETDQNEEWLDRDTGWVIAACQEINQWNYRNPPNPIVCVCLYRWYDHDKWKISPKPNVIEMFKKSFWARYTSPEVKEKIYMPQIDLAKPHAEVIVPAGANLRSGPSLDSPIEERAVTGTFLEVIGKTPSAEWLQVKTDKGKPWVSITVVRASNIVNVPVSWSSSSQTPAEQVIQRLDKEWLINSWSRVLGVDVRIVKAVLVIESGGRAFENGRMIIRFENHVFLDQLRKFAPLRVGTYGVHFMHGTPAHTGHHWRKHSLDRWEPQHEKWDQNEEWEVLELARKIDEQCALRSISMGMAQVMGFNHVKVGYRNVRDMFLDYNHSVTGEFNQLTGFFAFIFNSDLVKAIREKNWEQIAAVYNGTGGIAQYAPAIRQKYLELGGTD